MARLKLQVGQVALAQFQNRNLDTAAQLFVTPDTEGFLSQISTVEKVSENQNSVLQDYQQEQARLADLEHSAETDLAALAEQEKQLKALRKASDKKIAEAKAVLAKLTAEERRRSPTRSGGRPPRPGPTPSGTVRAPRARSRPNGAEREHPGREQRGQPWRPRPGLRPGPAGQALPLRRGRAQTRTTAPV